MVSELGKFFFFGGGLGFYLGFRYTLYIRVPRGKFRF